MGNRVAYLVELYGNILMVFSARIFHLLFSWGTKPGINTDDPFPVLELWEDQDPSQSF